MIRIWTSSGTRPEASRVPEEAAGLQPTAKGGFSMMEGRVIPIVEHSIAVVEAQLACTKEKIYSGASREELQCSLLDLERAVYILRCQFHTRGDERCSGGRTF